MSLFTFDNIQPMKGNRIDSDISQIIFEANIETSTLMSKYRRLMTETLTSNGNVYTDQVRTVLIESSKEFISKAVDNFKDIIESIDKMKESLEEKLEELEDKNKEIIEKYQPLLRQLDTSRISYEVSKYTLDKLSVKNMISRLYTALEKDLKFDSASLESTKAGSKETYISNTQIMDQILKKAILGVSPTIDVSTSFYDVVKNMLVDYKTKETKVFSDNIYDELKDTLEYLDEDDINELISVSKDELKKIQDIQQTVLMGKDNNEEDDEYSENLVVNFHIFKKFAFTLGISIIEDIIKLKFNIIKEKCSDYRKIIINTYQTLSDGTEKMDISNIYKPEEDYFIEMAYPECISDRELI
ncbi:MAG: hypothetical protein KGZ74_08405 [Chitinophagaceae bacterium]|nr:hypothetical protein [Chitinophagaceae bacterium]